MICFKNFFLEVDGVLMRKFPLRGALEGFRGKCEKAKIFHISVGNRNFVKFSIQDFVCDFVSRRDAFHPSFSFQKILSRVFKNFHAAFSCGFFDFSFQKIFLCSFDFLKPFLPVGDVRFGQKRLLNPFFSFRFPLFVA